MTDLPKKLGKYEIRRVIGRGAMGLVFEGYDPYIDRVVAIKTIKKEGLDPDQLDDFLQRFRSEAKAAGRLQHPNIVTIYDFGEDGDVHYIVMELVHGRDLKTHFTAQTPFSLAQVGKLMGELLAALHYSHSRGVIHRDVKPDNVFVTNEASVKLGDFGIARIDASQRTLAGKLVGTPSYMAPEQIRGETVDARSDVYSAGVILYQFLVGERPFTGSMMVVMQKVLMEAPKLPSIHNPKLPSVIDDVVMRALAKSPAERFSSALEFSRDLTWAIGLASEDTNEPTQIAPLDISELSLPQESTNPSMPSQGGVIVKPPASSTSRLEEKRRERQRLEAKAGEWQTITQALLEESGRLRQSFDAVIAEGRLLVDGETLRRAVDDWAMRGGTASEGVRHFMGSADLLTLETQEALEERAATLDATISEQRGAAERLRREASAAQASIAQGLRVLDQRIADHDEAWAGLESLLEAFDPQSGEQALAELPARISAVAQSMDQVSQSVVAVRGQGLQLPTALTERLTGVEGRVADQRERGAAVQQRLASARQAALEAAEARRREEEARRLAEEARRREAEARRLAEEARQREEVAKREAQARARAQAQQWLARTQALLEESTRLASAGQALRDEGRLLLDGVAHERLAEAMAERLRATRGDMQAALDAESALPGDAREASAARLTALADAAALHQRAVDALRKDAETARSECKQRLRALEKQSSGHDAAWALEEAAVRALGPQSADGVIADAQARTTALEQGMAQVSAACQAMRSQAPRLPAPLLERVSVLEARLESQRGQARRVHEELSALRIRIEAARAARKQAEDAKRAALEAEAKRQAQAEQQRREREAEATRTKAQAEQERREREAEATRVKALAEQQRREREEEEARAQVQAAERQRREREAEEARQKALAEQQRREQEAEEARVRTQAAERQRQERESEEARQKAQGEQQRREREAQEAQEVQRQAAEQARRREQARALAQPWIATLDGLLAEAQDHVASADALMSQGRLLIDAAASLQAAAAFAARAREACEGARKAAAEVQPLHADLAADLEARARRLHESVAAQQAWGDRLRREEHAARAGMDQRLRTLERQSQAAMAALGGIEETGRGLAAEPHRDRIDAVRGRLAAIGADLEEAEAGWADLAATPLRLPADTRARAEVVRARLDELRERVARVEAEAESASVRAREIEEQSAAAQRQAQAAARAAEARSAAEADAQAGARIDAPANVRLDAEAKADADAHADGHPAEAKTFETETAPEVSPDIDQDLTVVRAVPAEGSIDTAPSRATQAARATQPTQPAQAAAPGRRIPVLPIGIGVAAAAVLGIVLVSRSGKTPEAPIAVQYEPQASSPVATEPVPTPAPAATPAPAPAQTQVATAAPAGEPATRTAAPVAPGRVAIASPAPNTAPNTAANTAPGAALGTRENRPPGNGAGQTPYVRGDSLPPLERPGARDVTTPAPESAQPSRETTPSAAQNPAGSSTQAPTANSPSPERQPPSAVQAPPPSESGSAGRTVVALNATAGASGGNTLPEPGPVAGPPPEEKFEKGVADFNAGKFSQGLRTMKSAISAGYKQGWTKMCALVAATNDPAVFDQEIACRGQRR